MTKEQAQLLARNLLQEKINIDNPLLKNIIIEDIVSRMPDDPELVDWEQYRVIKQRLDYIWQSLKKCSERHIVSAKVESMVESFPRPKAARKKVK